MGDLRQADVPNGHAGDDGIADDEGAEHTVSYPRVDIAHLWPFAAERVCGVPFDGDDDLRT
jgi:hypothetical protein